MSIRGGGRLDRYLRHPAESVRDKQQKTTAAHELDANPGSSDGNRDHSHSDRSDEQHVSGSGDHGSNDNRGNHEYEEYDGRHE